MRFIAQVRLPDSLRVGGQQMAYIFMTDYADGTYDPDAGENAIILQPAKFEPIVQCAASAMGPTLQRPIDVPGAKRREFEDTELAVTLRDVEPGGPESEQTMSQFLGEPRWLQNEEVPRGGPWRFLMQIDSAEGQYDVNFGDAGVAYVFIAEDGTQARFFWQCM